MKEERREVEKLFERARGLKERAIFIEHPRGKEEDARTVIEILDRHLGHRLTAEDSDIDQILKLQHLLMILEDSEGSNKEKWKEWMREDYGEDPEGKDYETPVEVREGEGAYTKFYGRLDDYPFSGLLLHFPIRIRPGKDKVEGHHGFQALLKTPEGYYLHGKNEHIVITKVGEAIPVPATEVEISHGRGGLRVVRQYRSPKPGDVRGEEERLVEIEKKLKPLIDKIRERLGIEEFDYNVHHDRLIIEHKPGVRKILTALEGRKVVASVNNTVGHSFSLRTRNLQDEHTRFNTLMLELAEALFKEDRKRAKEVIEQLKRLAEGE